MKFSHVKLYLLCIVVGGMTGLITVPFRYLLVKSSDLRDILFSSSYSWWFHPVIITIMWIIGIAIWYLVKKYPIISGSGIPQIEGAIFGRFQFIHPLKALIAKFIGGVAGIGMGFSLGREGPSVQMGGFIAKLIGKWGKANISEQRYLYTGGASAGLSSAFTAPLASTIFIIEEVEKFDSVKIAISSLLAAIISGWIASQIFTVNSYTLINTAYPDEMNIGEIAIAFILFSTLLTIIGKTFNYLLLRFQKQYRGSRIPVSIRILGIIIVTYIVGYFFSGLVAGGEKFLLKEANTIHTEMGILVILIIIKLLFTTLCYATGFPGGIFLPLLVIGGLTGKLFALLLIRIEILSPEHFGFFMLIGMSALFAAVVRSPITGIILILEMTQKFNMLIPITVVVGITYFISEIWKVKPIYDQLYKNLLPANYSQSDERITIPFEINTESYLAGRTNKTINLPYGCHIENVIRNNECISNKNYSLKPGDQINISLYSKDLEKLYRSLRNITNE